MARGRKTGGKDFEKGHKGGPGKPPTPPDIRASRALTREEFERVAYRLLFINQQEFQTIVKNAETPMFDLMMAAVIHKAVVEGDERRMDFLLSRLIGKVVQPISGPDGKPLPLVQIFLPSNGREAPHIKREKAPIEAEGRRIPSGESSKPAQAKKA